MEKQHQQMKKEVKDSKDALLISVKQELEVAQDKLQKSLNDKVSEKLTEASSDLGKQKQWVEKELQSISSSVSSSLQKQEDDIKKARVWFAIRCLSVGSRRLSVLLQSLSCSFYPFILFFFFFSPVSRTILTFPAWKIVWLLSNRNLLLHRICCPLPPLPPYLRLLPFPMRNTPSWLRSSPRCNLRSPVSNPRLPNPLLSQIVTALECWTWRTLSTS
jgi:hypothetical protein